MPDDVASLPKAILLRIRESESTPTPYVAAMARCSAVGNVGPSDLGVLIVAQRFSVNATSRVMVASWLGCGDRGGRGCPRPPTTHVVAHASATMELVLVLSLTSFRRGRSRQQRVSSKHVVKHMFVLLIFVFVVTLLPSSWKLCGEPAFTFGFFPPLILWSPV